MFAILYRRRVRVLPKDCVLVAHQFWAPQNAVFLKPFSSRKSTPRVCENDSEKSFTVYYLINSCGLSSNDAISASEKLCFESPEKPDAVLKLLREYGFTDAHISRIVTRWPGVFLSCPNKTLLPKLEFFRSIGVPLPVLAHKLSVYPSILMRSLKNTLIPSYNGLKNGLQSDESVVLVFSRAPRAFEWCWPEGVCSNMSMLRERGVPGASIVSLITDQPPVLSIGKEKLILYVDRAVEMGFDISKRVFIYAVRVFVDVSQSTFEHKMELCRSCGWSESEVIAAFLRYPLWMKVPEKKIIANMDFLVSKLGLKPVDIAECPKILLYSLEKRIKPRCLVAGILKEKGLKKMTGAAYMLGLSEVNFLKSYIVKYQKDYPELLDLYKKSKEHVPELGHNGGARRGHPQAQAWRIPFWKKKKKFGF